MQKNESKRSYYARRAREREAADAKGRAGKRAALIAEQRADARQDGTAFSRVLHRRPPAR